MAKFSSCGRSTERLQFIQKVALLAVEKEAYGIPEKEISIVQIQQKHCELQSVVDV